VFCLVVSVALSVCLLLRSEVPPSEACTMAVRASRACSEYFVYLNGLFKCVSVALSKLSVSSPTGLAQLL